MNRFKLFCKQTYEDNFKSKEKPGSKQREKFATMRFTRTLWNYFVRKRSCFTLYMYKINVKYTFRNFEFNIRESYQFRNMVHTVYICIRCKRYLFIFLTFYFVLCNLWFLIRKNVDKNCRVCLYNKHNIHLSWPNNCMYTCMYIHKCIRTYFLNFCRQIFSKGSHTEWVSFEPLGDVLRRLFLRPMAGAERQLFQLSQRHRRPHQVPKESKCAGSRQQFACRPEVLLVYGTVTECVRRNISGTYWESDGRIPEYLHIHSSYIRGYKQWGVYVPETKRTHGWHQRGEEITDNSDVCSEQLSIQPTEDIRDFVPPVHVLGYNTRRLYTKRQCSATVEWRPLRGATCQNDATAFSKHGHVPVRVHARDCVGHCPLS